MFERGTLTKNRIRFTDTLPLVALLLVGVPALTLFVMAAVRYVASGSF